MMGKFVLAENLA